MKRISVQQMLFMTVFAVVVFTAGLFVGQRSDPEPVVSSRPLQLSPLLIQDENDPRELIPLPGPGQQGGQPQPGEGQAPQECGIFLYQDGQLYQLQPGQQLPGMGDGNPELIPLNPVPGGPGGPSPSPAPAPEPPRGLDT